MYLSNWIMFVATLYCIHFERERATALQKVIWHELNFARVKYTNKSLSMKMTCCKWITEEQEFYSLAGTGHAPVQALSKVAYLKI